MLARSMELLDRVRRAVEVTDQVLSGAFASSMAWAEAGARSVGSWLASHGETTRAAASARCRTGQRLRAMPATSTSALAGRLGGAKTRLLADTAADEAIRDRFLEHEVELVETVEGLTVDGSRAYLAAWAERARAEAGADGDDPGYDAEDVLHLSSTWRGRWRIDGSLGPEAGAALEAALDAEIERWRNDGLLADDRRTWSQLRAAALLSLLRRVAEPGSSGELRPLVLALVDADTLDRRRRRKRSRRRRAVPWRGRRGSPPASTDGTEDRSDGSGAVGGDERETGVVRAGGRSGADGGHVAAGRSCADGDHDGDRSGAEPDPARDDLPFDGIGEVDDDMVPIHEIVGSGPVAPEVIRRLLCEGDLCRVVVDGESMPLDVGRRFRLATANQRRAVIAAAHGSCQWPGCDAPHRWCHVHHLQDWDDEGPTDIANLALLCGRHHRLVHEGGFGLERIDAGLVATDRDGWVVTVPYVDRPRWTRPA